MPDLLPRPTDGAKGQPARDISPQYPAIMQQVGRAFAAVGDVAESRRRPRGPRQPISRMTLWANSRSRSASISVIFVSVCSRTAFAASSPKALRIAVARVWRSWRGDQGGIPPRAGRLAGSRPGSYASCTSGPGGASGPSATRLRFGGTSGACGCSSGDARPPPPPGRNNTYTHPDRAKARGSSGPWSRA